MCTRTLPVEPAHTRNWCAQAEFVFHERQISNLRIKCEPFLKCCTHKIPCSHNHWKIRGNIGKNVSNYFSWNEKLQVSVRPTIRLNKTASLDFNWRIGLARPIFYCRMPFLSQTVSSFALSHAWRNMVSLRARHHWALNKAIFCQQTKDSVIF